MLWVVIAASVIALAAVIFGVVRARKAQEALGMAAIKKWKKSWVPIRKYF